MTAHNQGVGLSEQERADLSVRARRRMQWHGWVFAGFAVVGAAVMAGFVLKLASDLPPGRDPTRLWVVGSVVTAFVLATFVGAALLMRRRARNPELLLGTGRSTQAAVRRALRDGHSTDPRIDALAREAARHQLQLLRGRRRFLPWAFVVAGLLYLTGLVANWILGGFGWSTLPSAFGLVVLVGFGAHFVGYVSRCRRYLTTTPAEAGDRTDVAHPDRS